ncbi:MAG: hypothetical protein JSV03_15500, partial [Planctomycetota bacterium]
MANQISFKYLAIVFAIVFVSHGTANITSAQSLSVIDGFYRSDFPFPEYMPLWREGWKWTDANGERVRYAYKGMPLGGYIHIYVQNQRPEPLDIKDVYLNNVSLSKGVVPENAIKNK